MKELTAERPIVLAGLKPALRLTPPGIYHEPDPIDRP